LTKPPPEQELGFIGVVMAGESTLVEPTVSGRIEKLLVKPGEEIRAGAPIAQLDVRSAKPELGATRSSSRSVSDSTVVAPFGGVVTQQYLSQGALAGPGKPIVRLLGKAPPQVRFAIPEDRAPTVAPDMPVTIQGQPDVDASGLIVEVTPDVDDASGMFYARANVNLSPELAARLAKRGLVVRVLVRSDARRAP